MTRRRIPTAEYGSPEHPLRIGDLELPCYVLDDGRRVIVQHAMLKAMGMSHGGSSGTGGDRLAKFTDGKLIKPFISEDLATRTREPIVFSQPRGGRVAYGYEATSLADLCESVLAARKAGVLQPNQLHIAEQCEILMRGFARVGIVALIDEATGYQAVRDRDELHRLLAVYLAEERLKWAKMFPDEFYSQIYRLRGWSYPRGRGRTPLIGKITNEVVYEKLPPGVLGELRKRNPVVEGKKTRAFRHFQFLSSDIGQPDLRNHLLQVIALMRASPTWKLFKQLFDRAFPEPRKKGQDTTED